MPGIRRGPRIGGVDVTEIEDEEVKPRPRYCVRCKEMFGILAVVGPRIIIPDKPKPADYDNYLECHNCGIVYGNYEVKHEADITSLVEPDRNPFDRAQGFFEPVRESRRYDRTGKTQMIRKRKKAIEDLKDPDVRRELQKSCNELVKYSQTRL